MMFIMEWGYKMPSYNPIGLANISQKDLSQLAPSDFLKWQTGLLGSMNPMGGTLGGTVLTGAAGGDMGSGGPRRQVILLSALTGLGGLAWGALKEIIKRWEGTGVWNRIPSNIRSAIQVILGFEIAGALVTFVDDLIEFPWENNGNGNGMNGTNGMDDMNAVPALPFDIDYGNGYLPPPVAQKLLEFKKFPPDPPEARWLVDIIFWWVANGVLFGKLEHGGRIVYEWDSMRWRRLARQPKRVSVGPGGAKNARSTAKAAEWILKEIATNKRIYDKFTRKAAPRRRRISVRESGPGNVVINE
jgi:hypothetical protein